MKMRKMITAVVMAAGVASAANADTIGLDFQGLGLNRNITITYNGANGSFGGADNTRSVGAGRLNFQVSSVSGAAANYFSVGQQITSFCVDIFQNAGSGVVNFGGLENAPDPSSVSPMGLQRAGLISVLYALRHNDAINGVGGAGQTAAAAFQLAIWEIVHEDSADLGAATFADTGLDVQDDGTGVFFASGTGTTALAVQNTANQWLAEAWAAWSSGMKGLRMASAYGDGFQDQALIIPLPAPVLMAGLGLLAIPLIRRRFC